MRPERNENGGKSESTVDRIQKLTRQAPDLSIRPEKSQTRAELSMERRGETQKKKEKKKKKEGENKKKKSSNGERRKEIGAIWEKREEVVQKQEKSRKNKIK